jgi:hypothetical protein
MKRLVPYLALLVCLGFGYLGRLCATRLVYQYKQSTWFSSLGRQDAEQLRRTGQTALAISVSSLMIQNTTSSIQHNVNNLAKIRGKAPQELGPILDLRLAKDYAMLVRLEQQAGNQSAAAGHQQSAQALLRSLGWKDVSENDVANLADLQLRSRLKR